MLGLYDVLVDLTGSPVVRLNRAVALAEVRGADEALAAVDAIGGLGSYHLLPAVRADLLRRAGRHDEAVAEYRRALELVDREGDRRFLARRLAQLAR